MASSSEICSCSFKKDLKLKCDTDELTPNWAVTKDEPKIRLASTNEKKQQPAAKHGTQELQFLKDVVGVKLENEALHSIAKEFRLGAGGFHIDSSNAEISGLREEATKKGETKRRFFNVWMPFSDVHSSPLGFIGGIWNTGDPTNPGTYMQQKSTSIFFKDMKAGDFVIFDSEATWHAALPLTDETGLNARFSTEMRFNFVTKE